MGGLDGARFRGTVDTTQSGDPSPARAQAGYLSAVVGVASARRIPSASVCRVAILDGAEDPIKSAHLAWAGTSGDRPISGPSTNRGSVEESIAPLRCADGSGVACRARPVGVGSSMLGGVRAEPYPDRLVGGALFGVDEVVQNLAVCVGRVAAQGQRPRVETVDEDRHSRGIPQANDHRLIPGHPLRLVALKRPTSWRRGLARTRSR